jgi:hypothetical protein
MAGMQDLRIWPAVDKAAKLLSATGYKNQIAPELRDEIRRYYAQDNSRLDALLRTGAQRLKSIQR